MIISLSLIPFCAVLRFVGEFGGATAARADVLEGSGGAAEHDCAPPFLHGVRVRSELHLRSVRREVLFLPLPGHP